MTKSPRLFYPFLWGAYKRLALISVIIIFLWFGVWWAY